MIQKYSKQREAIRSYLSGTDRHPTADTIYTELRKIHPHISMGTVYRNLTALAESGEILRIPGSDGSDHFDADTRPHSHFVCRRCRALLDLPFSVSGLTKEAQNGFAGEIESVSLIFSGICPDCSKGEQ